MVYSSGSEVNFVASKLKMPFEFCWDQWNVPDIELTCVE